MFTVLSSFGSFEDIMVTYVALVPVPLSKIRAVAILFLLIAEN
jgi:hypothetical protein